MNTAAAMDAELEMYVANGTALPYLFCVPILVKDNMDMVDGKKHALLCCCCLLLLYMFCCSCETHWGATIMRVLGVNRMSYHNSAVIFNEVIVSANKSPKTQTEEVCKSKSNLSVLTASKAKQIFGTRAQYCTCGSALCACSALRLFHSSITPVWRVYNKGLYVLRAFRLLPTLKV